MNLVAGVLAIFLCALIGYFFSLKHKEREIFYKDFSDFNKVFKKEIEFSKSSLFSIIDENYKSDGDFYRIVKDVVKNKKKLDKNIKYL